jgi:hypothetical protein
MYAYGQHLSLSSLNSLGFYLEINNLKAPHELLQIMQLGKLEMTTRLSPTTL